MIPSALRFSSISHRYSTNEGGAVHALDHIDLTVEAGEFVAIVGPSGCGKSTLLRMAAGLLPPSEGYVLAQGERVVGPREDMAMVFQRPTLLPWLSTRQNVEFPARHRHGTVSTSEKQRAQKLLELTDLVDFADRRPHELSGGMQQRVALARALFSEPAVLLMDEPFPALDALTRDQMCLELLQLLAARPMTTLFITHSVTEAVLLAHRVVVMSLRPGTIREVINVDLPKHRTLASMRLPGFAKAVDQLRDLLLVSHNAPTPSI